MGRPSKYSEEIADEVVKLLHSHSLREICRDHPELPCRETITDWMADNVDFSTRCARAREEHAQLYVEEGFEIIDELPTHEVPDPDGGVSVRVDPAGVTRNKNRADYRRWYASKILAKKYGDKIQNEVSGPDGAPIKAEINIQFVRTENVDGN